MGSAFGSPTRRLLRSVLAPGAVAALALTAGVAPAASQQVIAPQISARQVIECPAPGPLVGDLEHPMAAVRYLADDALEGRLSGSRGERCAAEYIALELARVGVAPYDPPTGYLQPVRLQSAVNPHAPEGSGMNVIGVLEGADPVLRDEAVVVGAHHDHLGFGQVFGSLADEPGEIHNGADDNASGVGALLAAAKFLAQGDRPARTVVFVTFTGEELGLLGSAHYADNPVVPLERTVAMLNMDMVGRLGGDPLIVNGTGTAAEWDTLLDVLEEESGITLARAPDGFGPSDHTSFYARGVPVLHFFTNVHEDYHRPNDEWHRVDSEGLERVSALVGALVREIANRPEAPTPVEGVGTPPQTGQAGYGAYLGTVPDFAPVDFGVRLSGVTSGSPADEGGLRAGDVLVGLGPFEIEDLYVLTEALQTLQPGDEVEAVVLRDAEELVFTVVLGSR